MKTAKTAKVTPIEMVKGDFYRTRDGRVVQIIFIEDEDERMLIGFDILYAISVIDENDHPYEVTRDGFNITKYEMVDGVEVITNIMSDRDLVEHLKNK